MIFIFLVLILGISSCALEPDYLNYPTYHYNENNFRDIKDILIFVYINAKYKSDQDQFGTKEYWQSPSEFYANHMTGDCEDINIFLAALSYDKFGIKPEFISLLFEDNTQHFIIKIDSLYYDAVIGFFGNINIHENYFGNKIKEILYYKYDYVLYLSYNTHNIIMTDKPYKVER